MATYRITNGIKYNPANWAGLEESERKACARFAAKRERELNTITATPWVCVGGPFPGVTLEIDSTTDRTATMVVGGWVGHYELMNDPEYVKKNGAPSCPADGPRLLGWFGNHAGAPVNTHGTATSSKSEPEFSQPGFDQLRDLLAELSDDPAERATASPLGPRAAYTIGRTTFTIAATEEAAEAMKARVIKAKRWFADKMLNVAPMAKLAEPVPVECSDTQADAYIQAIAAQEVGELSEAIVAIEQVQGVATAELATVCAADPAQAVGSVGIGAAIPADSTPAQKTTERSPQADHLAARATVAQRHAEKASAAPGVGGGGGSPFENEISPASFLGDVPLSLAVQAHNGTSFSPEKRGARAQKEHAEAMAADYKEMHAQAVRGGTLDLLPEVFARYRARQASTYRAYLASSSRIVSSFIAGPSNFPAERMNKRADIAHRRLTEYLDGGEMAKSAAIRTLRPDLRAIMAGDADAVDRLTVKINAAEREQQAMKEANKAIRQHAKAGEAAQLEALMGLGFSESRAVEMLHPRWGNAQGFPSYRLTNNNANIRRMRERLEQITKAQACEVVEIEGADGIRLEDDAPANRVRLFFPGKPAAEIRDTLKARGFRWAPTVGAWQAYRNSSTLKTAQEMAGKPSEADEPSTTTPSEAEPQTEQAPTMQATTEAAQPAPAPAQAAPIEPAAPTPAATTQNSASEAPALPQAAPSDNPTANGTGFAQQAASHIGSWCAAMYRNTQGAHVLRFDVPHLAPHFSVHETRAELMAELQASAEQADRETLSRFSALDCTGEEVRSMAPRFFDALHAHMESINYHTEALLIQCHRGGRDDLAAGLMHLAKYQAAPDNMGISWEMSEARRAIAQTLRTGTADPVSPEAQTLLESWGLFLWGQTPSDPPPGVGCAAHSILESATGFSKVKPFTLDPRDLLSAGFKAEQLVGLGVFYLGNAASASGDGAITEATDTRGQSFGDLNIVCTLEDGRVIKANAYSFTGELRPIFKFDGKMHGKPYLAQLAAVRASLKAQHSSAQAMAEAEHARQLETIAAQFPQLERPGKNQGGKLAAINIRKLLKQAFKSVKFSVTSDYNSARVSWTDGPTAEQVNEVIGRFDIGHSDSQSDYFYTTETAFSKLFGGVQYLTTRRDHTDQLIPRAIAEAFHGREVPQDATPKDWRSASGAFAWHTDGGQMYSRRVREILSKTPA